MIRKKYRNECKSCCIYENIKKIIENRNREENKLYQIEIIVNCTRVEIKTNRLFSIRKNFNIGFETRKRLKIIYVKNIIKTTESV